MKSFSEFKLLILGIVLVVMAIVGGHGTMYAQSAASFTAQSNSKAPLGTRDATESIVAHSGNYVTSAVALSRLQNGIQDTKTTMANFDPHSNMYKFLGIRTDLYTRTHLYIRNNTDTSSTAVGLAIAQSTSSLMELVNNGDITSQQYQELVTGLTQLLKQ